MAASNSVSEIRVEGMTCSNCAMSVRRTLEKQGMEQVDVNFATGDVRFHNVPNRALADIQHSIEEIGYTVLKSGSDSHEKKNS